jgi:hypothetical protein
MVRRWSTCRTLLRVRRETNGPRARGRPRKPRARAGERFERRSFDAVRATFRPVTLRTLGFRTSRGELRSMGTIERHRDKTRSARRTSGGAIAVLAGLHNPPRWPPPCLRIPDPPSTHAREGKSKTTIGSRGPQRGHPRIPQLPATAHPRRRSRWLDANVDRPSREPIPLRAGRAVTAAWSCPAVIQVSGDQAMDTIVFGSGMLKRPGFHAPSGFCEPAGWSVTCSAY